MFALTPQQIEEGKVDSIPVKRMVGGCHLSTELNDNGESPLSPLALGSTF